MYIPQDFRICALKSYLDCARNLRKGAGKFPVYEFGARFKIKEHSGRFLPDKAEKLKRAFFVCVVCRIKDEYLYVQNSILMHFMEEER